MRLQLDSSSVAAGAHAGAVGSFGAVGANGSNKAGLASADSVSISGATGILQRAAVDHASRVQQLAASVRAGSYSFSASLVGSAIVAQAGG